MFQSTHPRRGATHQTNRCAKSYGVSIHAPQAGCDPELKFLCVLIMFQSTHPRRGATLPTLRTSVLLKLFQSTHPRRGATLDCSSFGRQFQVSIHAPQAGCDISPGREQTPWTVSIHAPQAGCDCIKRKGLKVRVICGTFCERIGVDFL